MDDPLEFHREGDLATITLNRPAKRNALNARMKTALLNALEDLTRNPPMVLLLTGAGAAFSAGQDLEERRFPEQNDLGKSVRDFYAPLVLDLQRLPSVTLAVVPGVAAGAGANIALACDLVLAARSAVFLQPFGRIGLVPDAAGTWTLPHAMGAAAARAALLLGEPISADAAERLGLIWKSVPDDALQETAADTISKLTKQSPEALCATLDLLRRPSADLANHLEREATFQARLGQTDYYRDAVARFLNRSSGA